MPPLPRRYVPGTGPREATLAIVGEQPGKDEVLRRKPFVGPSGKVLDSCLISAGIIRGQTYITNTIKSLEFPLKHYLDTSKRTPVVSVEGRACIAELKEELLYVSPNVVVVTGNVPLFALCNRTGITKWRGSIIESTLIPGLKVVPTIHPATVLRPKNVYLNKHLIQQDLACAKEQSAFPDLRLTPRKMIINPSFQDCVDYLSNLRTSTSVIDFDIEVVNLELFCISFAKSEFEAISIPFIRGNENSWSPENEMTLMRLIAQILENPYIPKRGQNLVFDSHFLLRKYGIAISGPIHDTMVAQKISLPDYPAGLDFITTEHTDMPYYKGEGKKYMKVGGELETFWAYNARDSLATAAAHPNQIDQLIKQGNIPTYDRHCILIPPLVYMMERGIKVDVEGMLAGRQAAEREVFDLESQLFSLVGREINYTSPKQMKEYFYGEKNLPPYKNRKTGGITCDEKALTRIYRKGFPEAKLVLRLRSLSTKTLGTYLSLDKIDPDGRYRSQYNPVGARTGRLSSSENIFGTGGNQQNWPHDLLKYLVADEGYVAYSFDLSQIENRIVAYVGRVIEMIEAFESGQDVHSLTAGLMFGKPPSEVTRDDHTCDLGDGTHSERFWGKKANHSLNYDISFREFALVNEMTEKEAKLITTRYHQVYPGVRSNFHAMVQRQLGQSRTLTNLFGRRRLFLNQWGRDLFKEAYAHIPQSTTADKINEQGINFIYYNQSQFAPVELLRQVHDDIGFQIPVALPWLEHAKILTAIKSSLETPLSYHEREFVVPCDLTYGLSFTKDPNHSVEIKAKNFPDEASLATKLKEDYHALQVSASEMVVGT